jgi:hypothetical protein
VMGDACNLKLPPHPPCVGWSQGSCNALIPTGMGLRLKVQMISTQFGLRGSIRTKHNTVDDGLRTRKISTFSEILVRTHPLKKSKSTKKEHRSCTSHLTRANSPKNQLSKFDPVYHF